MAGRLAPNYIRKHFDGLAEHPAHWPCIAFSNHDVPRTVTRFGAPPQGNPALAKLMFALLCSLRGTALIYQGEELGLPDVDLRRDQLRDPVGDLYFPVAKGRDGCRTPMPWDARAPNLGFTSGKPWLPLGPAHTALAVSEQEHTADSMLIYARHFLAARKKSPALRLGEIKFLDAGKPVLIASVAPTDPRRNADTNIKTGHTYHYFVTAVAASVRVAKSNVANVYVVRAPQTLAFSCQLVTVAAATDVSCHWSATIRPAAIRYILWRSVDGAARTAVYHTGIHGTRTFTFLQLLTLQSFGSFDSRLN